MGVSSVVAAIFGDWIGASLTLAVFGVSYLLYSTFSFRKNGPPGPFPLPLLGNFVSIMRQPDYSYEYFRKLREKYGSVMTMFIGPYPFVVVNSYEGFKNTLMKYQAEFAGRPVVTSMEQMMEASKSIGFGDYGPAWSLHRKIAMTALKHFVSKDTLTDLVNSEISDVTEKMVKHEGSLDPHNYLYDMLYGVISKIVFGKGFSEQERLWMAKEIRELNESFGSGFLVDYLPLWLGNRLPQSPALKKVIKGVDEIMDKIMEKVNDHRKNFDRDNINDYVDGILLAQLFLQATPTVPRMLSQMFICETLSWTFSLLLQTRLPSPCCGPSSSWSIIQMRQQIREVAGERAVVLSDKPQMPYVEAVYLEVMRLKPIAPLALFHTTTCDVTVEAFGHTPQCTIPKGTQVLPNIWACHHDPALWGEDHGLFRPERFLTDDGRQVVKREGFMAFSAGRRQCLGEQIARQDLFLLLAGLVQRCRLKTAGTPPPTEPSTKGGPFAIMPHRYEVNVGKV